MGQAKARCTLRVEADDLRCQVCSFHRCTATPPLDEPGQETIGVMSKKVDLDKLEALAKAAMPGDWRSAVTYLGVETTQEDNRGILYGGALWVPDPEDDDDQRKDEHARRGPFIAAASPDVVLALIERIRALEVEVAGLKDHFKDLETCTGLVGLAPE